MSNTRNRTETFRSPRPWRPTAVAACFTFLLLALAPAHGQGVPLRSGKVVDGEIRETDAKGVVVETPAGAVKIPWGQVSQSHPLHPLYRERSRSAEEWRRLAVEFTFAETVRTTIPDRFTFVLALVFAVFWLNVFSVWLVSREKLVSGAASAAWNLAALILGPPVAAVFLLKHRGALFVPRRPKGFAGVCRLCGEGGEPIEGTNEAERAGLPMAAAILARAVQEHAEEVRLGASQGAGRAWFWVAGTLRGPELFSAEAGRRVTAGVRLAAGMAMVKLQEERRGLCRLIVNDTPRDLEVVRTWEDGAETLTVRIPESGEEGA